MKESFLAPEMAANPVFRIPDELKLHDYQATVLTTRLIRRLSSNGHYTCSNECKDVY